MQSSGTSLDWNESDTVSYWSRKPDHQGRSALVLAGAYAEVESLTPPLVVPKSHEDDPAYAKVSETYLGSCVCVLEAHMFLPSSDNFIFVDADPLGSERFVTSTANLEWALGVVNDAHWQATRSQIAEWGQRGPLVRKMIMVEDGKYVGEEDVPLPHDQFTHAAQFGFSIYHEALDFAELHRVPILTDG